MKRAIVLLSGGVDSSTVFAIARSEGYECCALSFKYGQRHYVELQAARQVANRLGAAEHKVVNIALGHFGGSALTDLTIGVPMGGTSEGIPVTYVPARNTIFLAYALAYAEVAKAGTIWMGVNAVDYSGYPDCRPEYVEAFERMANLATKAGVEGHRIEIRTPLIALSKREILECGQALGVPFELTHSCYDPSSDGHACGQCDSCRIRAAGFAEAGIRDPVAT